MSEGSNAMLLTPLPLHSRGPSWPWVQVPTSMKPTNTPQPAAVPASDAASRDRTARVAFLFFMTMVGISVLVAIGLLLF